MYSATTFWFAVLIALAVGALIGALAGRRLAPGASAQRRELERLRAEQDAYREHVTSHFQRTSELVNELTDSYRAVHNHLAQGARELCPEESQHITHLPEGAQSPRSLERVEPPRDYAPRERSELGALDEAYGLDKNTARKTDAPDPPRH